MVETHPEKRLIGYARVSTVGQTLDSQLEQLCAAGCGSRNIYREKVTGARTGASLTGCSPSWPPSSGSPYSEVSPMSAPKAAVAPRLNESTWTVPPSAQQKEATGRHTQGATLQELADRYDRNISTMRRATRAG